MIWLALAAIASMMILPTVMGLTLARPMSRRARIARTAAVLAEIVAATLIVPWAWFGMAFRWITVVAGIAAVAIGWSRGVKRRRMVAASRRCI